MKYYSNSTRQHVKMCFLLPNPVVGTDRSDDLTALSSYRTHTLAEWRVGTA